MTLAMWRYGLTRRGGAATLLTGALGFVAGVWVGLWSIPSKALDVPMEASEYGRGVDLAYQPVPTWLPVISILIAVGGLARLSPIGGER